MNEKDIRELLAKQKAYFRNGGTLSVDSRILALEKLKRNIHRREKEIFEALYKDLGKSKSESYMCEVGLAYAEIDYMIKHVRSFAARKKKRTPLAQAVSKSYVQPIPKGNVLIMSPWNYPFLLTIEPLVDALAAGNVVILKPSAYAPATAEVLCVIIQETFQEEHVAVVTGGRAENQALLNQKFNHIFFTGSQSVGKEVMKKAAEYLTPVSLELGGKSPCIVEKTADIRMAARRIVFGKFLNCGQTCVAPDYVFCDQSIAEKLKKALVFEIRKQFGRNPLENPQYGKIINEKHFSRLTALLEKEKILYGGNSDKSRLKIEPTMIGPCNINSEIMKDEIFGPLLPILTYSSLDSVLRYINSRPYPLACYIFSKDKKLIRKITETCPCGGQCVNDTMIHLATSQMGFGGFQESGMGSYHGKDGFDTFTHYKSVVDKKTWLDLPMRYAPYNRFHDCLIRLFLR